MTYKVTVEADTIEEVHELLQHLAYKTTPNPRRRKTNPARRKFTDEQVVDIRDRYTAGATMEDLKNEYHVAQGTIQQIVNRTSYREVQP